MASESTPSLYASQRDERLSRRRNTAVVAPSESFLSYYRTVLDHFIHFPADWENFLHMLTEPLPMTARLTLSHPWHWLVCHILVQTHHLTPLCCVFPSHAVSCSNTKFDEPNTHETVTTLHSAGLLTFQEAVSMLPVNLLLSATRSLSELPSTYGLSGPTSMETKVDDSERPTSGDNSSPEKGDVSSVPSPMGTKTSPSNHLISGHSSPLEKSHPLSVSSSIDVKREDSNFSTSAFHPLSEKNDLFPLPSSPNTKTPSLPASFLYSFSLDLCASPGSKSLHFLDSLLGIQKKGVLVCNEKDHTKATQLLPARLKRAQSPWVFCTRGDARRFPFLYSTLLKCFIKFSSILCDVPCSGDGTTRKDNTVLPRWEEGYGKNLQKTQQEILRRGLERLQERGVLVYSTCSMNPVENEEVVWKVLQEVKRSFLSVRLVNVREMLPHVKFAVPKEAGKDRIADKEDENAKWEDCEKNAPSYHEVVRMCGRVLPHTQNTGGFFLALFVRNAQEVSEGGETCPPSSPEVRNEKRRRYTEPCPPFGLSNGSDSTPSVSPSTVTPLSVFKTTPYGHWGGYRRYRDLTESEIHYFQHFYGLDAVRLRHEQGLCLVVHGTDHTPSEPKRVMCLTLSTYVMLHAWVYKGAKEVITMCGVRAFQINEKRKEGREKEVEGTNTKLGEREVTTVDKQLPPTSIKERSETEGGILYKSNVHQGYEAFSWRPTFEAARWVAPHTDQRRVVRLQKPAQMLTLLQDERLLCGPGEEDFDSCCSPGPVWISLELSHEALPEKFREVGEFSWGEKDETSVTESTKTEPGSPLWLSGILYRSHLQLMVEKSVRAGMAHVLKSVLTKLTS